MIIKRKEYKRTVANRKRVFLGSSGKEELIEFYIHRTKRKAREAGGKTSNMLNELFFFLYTKV